MLSIYSNIFHFLKTKILNLKLLILFYYVKSNILIHETAMLGYLTSDALKVFLDTVIIEAANQIFWRELIFTFLDESFLFPKT